MGEITFRRAICEDIAQIQAIWQESMALHANFDPTFRPHQHGHIVFGKFVQEQLASSASFVVVAVIGDAVAAYGICVLRNRVPLFENERYGLITDLDVAPAHRRLGLGERILTETTEWLKGMRVDRIEAEVVIANKIALAFWQKHGFLPYYHMMAKTV